MRIFLTIALLFAAASCGATAADEKAIRQSQRFYEAAYVSWAEQGDVLAAIRHLTRAVEENEANDDAQYLLGVLRMGRNEFALAEKHLQLALKHRRADRPSARAEAQNSLGLLYIHMQRLDEAVSLLKTAANEVLNREPWLAFGNLGWAYTELGDFANAEDALKRALFDQPRFCVVYYRLGALYYRHGQWEKARANLEQVTNSTESGCARMQEAWQLLGMVALRLESTEDAIEAFEKCVSINPTTDAGVECRAKRAGL